MIRGVVWREPGGGGGGCEAAGEGAAGAGEREVGLEGPFPAPLLLAEVPLLACPGSSLPRVTCLPQRVSAPSACSPVSIPLYGGVETPWSL